MAQPDSAQSERWVLTGARSPLGGEGRATAISGPKLGYDAWVEVVPAASAKTMRDALSHVRDRLLSPEGGDGVDLEIVERALG